MPDTNSILQVLAKFAKPEGGENTEAGASNTEASGPVASSSSVDSNSNSEPLSTQSSAANVEGGNVGQANELIMQLLQQGKQVPQPGSLPSGIESIPTGPSSSFSNPAHDSSNVSEDPRINRRRSRSPDAESSASNKRMRTDDSYDMQSSNLDSNQSSGEEEHIERARNVIRDPTIREGSIKVLSRTLFIGGIPHNMSDKELSELLSKFGKVQSVVIHKEGKHAFVKLYSRHEAEVTRERCEEERSSGRLSLRARWGVGFGPRECCEYETGISIIPLSKLTEADKRWTVEAEYGGTGGLPLESGLCIEEPDIEIGAGVSSKAISQRMPSNSSRNGPKSSRADNKLERGERPPRGSGFDNGRPFGKNNNRFGNGPGRGMHSNNGHGEDRRGRFDRSKRSGRGGRDNGGPGRFGNGPHQDMRGLHNRNGHNRGNDRGNDMMGNQGPMMGYGGMPNGNMGYGVPQMNNMGGMNNMNPLGNMGGGNNLPANLANLLSTLTQPNGGMGGGMPGPNQHNNGGHGGKRNRGRNNNHNNGNMGYGGNNNGNANDTLAQLSQLTQQLAAAQQYNGGGMPMNNMGMNNSMMGGNSYNQPNMPSDPRQRGPGGHHTNNNQHRLGNNNHQGPASLPNIPGVPGGPHQGGGYQAPPPGLQNNGGNNGGNAGLPFNVTPELAAMLLQQHQQQQQQRR